MLMVMVMMMKMEASVTDMGEERMRSRGRGGRRMRNRHGCRLKSFLTTTMINKEHYWLLRMRDEKEKQLSFNLYGFLPRLRREEAAGGTQ